MATDYEFTEDDLTVDETVGFPKVFAKLCRDRHAGLYSHGPPFTFTPYTLHQHEVAKAKELDQMLPVINPREKPTTKPKIFVSLLWKQLNHLGNAGFDPAVIRVDPYGNVLYYHADSASPLAWDIDHWFPCSRGGLTVPSNLRILQWQVCKKKHNKLEFLIPWWDFQLGISVNQFLSIFASSNSDFRHRAFSFLFSEGENEELNSTQTVESHSFPQHFLESKEKLGLAPAAMVVSRREFYDSSSALRSLDYNRQRRPHSPLIAARKIKPNLLKENEIPDFVSNPYQAIVMARDSLKHREETARMTSEIEKLDDEVNDMRRKDNEEKLTIHDLELALIKRRRKAEKCRRLAEAQTSYRTMLEKMIRDAMHQSVIYKEQVRLNQAASNALMARLEAQKAICDAAEKELYQKYRQREELESQLRPEWEHARKRSRIDDSFSEERGNSSRALLCLPEIKAKTHLHKELRVFLEEEQRASEEAALSQNGEEKQEVVRENALEHDTSSIVALEGGSLISLKFEKLEIGKEKVHIDSFPVFRRPEMEEDEESRKERGKGNVEKWLQMLLDNNPQELDPHNENENPKYTQKEMMQEECEDKEEKQKQQTVQDRDDDNKEKEEVIESENERSREREGEVERKEQRGKERKLVRSESARAFRRIPSSPSLILGMRKGVDCIGKKPMVIGDDEEDDHGAGNSFISSSIKTIKKAVKF